MSRLEQDPGLSQEITFSFGDLSEFKLTPEMLETLNRLESEFDKEPDVKKLFLYLKDRFGVLINRDELECCDGKPLGKKQYLEYPKRINDVIDMIDVSEPKPRLYKIPHYNQMILSNKFLDKQGVLLPERRKVLQQALEGIAYDEIIGTVSEKLMSVKVRGEKLISVLSRSEQKIFLNLLLGSVVTTYNIIQSLQNKIQNVGYEKDFRINRIYNQRGGVKGMGEYYLERIVLNRGIDLSE